MRSASGSRDRAGMTDLPPVFGVERTQLDRVPGVAVRGELDIGAVPDLTAALDAAIAETIGPFVVDLCDVLFMDSSGMSLPCTAGRRGHLDSRGTN